MSKNVSPVIHTYLPTQYYTAYNKSLEHLFFFHCNVALLLRKTKRQKEKQQKNSSYVIGQIWTLYNLVRKNVFLSIVPSYILTS
jgi:hypothetical protein